MVWLNPTQVAEKLGISRRSALLLMHEMPHSVISGKKRQRLRVSEKSLDDWMMKQSSKVVSISSTGTGTKKKLARR